MRLARLYEDLVELIVHVLIRLDRQLPERNLFHQEAKVLLTNSPPVLAYPEEQVPI